MVAAALVAMALLPLAEIVARGLFGRGIPGAGPFTQHLTLWVAFLGAALAARDGKLLALATGEFVPAGRWRDATRLFSSAVAAAVTGLLLWACLELVVSEREAGTVVAAGLPIWVAQLALPIGFALIAWRLVDRASDRRWGKAVAALGLAAGLAAGWHVFRLSRDFALEPEPFGPALPWLLLVGAATLLGAPIFAALGGAAVLLLLAEGVPAAAVPAETYRLVASQMLPAIPLFTLAGFLLAEGKASERLVRVFRGLFGSVPGGTAVVCALVCAFFTAFTGGSGVTILALGALLLQALRQERYSERFSLGLLTASGSLGLLFAPALPLILYGIVAQVPIEELFLGGIGPGLLLVVLVAAWGVREGLRGKVERQPFAWREALAALWLGKWELLLPAVILFVILTGIATPVEASAVAVVYALAVQAFIHRDLSLTRDLPRVLRECGVLIGGVLLILGVAMGLTNYLVDAQIPSRLVEWAQDSIGSRILFLLGLNLLLLAVGCLMDVFSAIVVVVPLIVPLGVAFGVDPVHLGIIFVANLELGYLTPPVGLNLFLASYRFDKPLLEIWRAALPWLAILGFGVLLITYWPGLTLGVLELLGRR